jgi:putative alpha-1,2-mannosidase
MYHALMSPNLSMDVDGSYRGPDNQVHHAAGFHFVSNLSLWDTYRAEHPLMTLLEPEERTSDLVNSMLASQRETQFGILPIWQEQGHIRLNVATPGSSHNPRSWLIPPVPPVSESPTSWSACLRHATP